MHESRTKAARSALFIASSSLRHTSRMPLPVTRARTRAAKFSSVGRGRTSLLLDLPDAVILYILKDVPSTSLATLSATCVAMHKDLVPLAVPMRAVMLGQRLCGAGCLLSALRFAEKRADRPAVTIAADTCHTMCVKHDGQVWAWGGHEQGPSDDEMNDEAPRDSPCWLLHLGLGRETGSYVTRPARVVGLPVGLRVLEVAAGYEHSLLRCSDGHVWACGVGEHGRLGHGVLTSSPHPVRIEGLEHVALVAAGGFQVSHGTCSLLLATQRMPSSLPPHLCLVHRALR